MKIQLDTTNKTVKIEENIKISKLIETLKQLLPNDWKNFTLETHTTIINWSEPYYYKPYRPYWESPFYCSGSAMNENTAKTADYQLKDGVFNVEV
jgi:hypothetical protein